MSTNREIVNQLAAIRHRCRLTQESIATRMGTSRSAVARLETDLARTPLLGTLERYAAAVGARITVVDDNAVSSLEQLDALPIGVIVRSRAGSIACRYDSVHGVVFGDNRPFPWLTLSLPVTVLWQPQREVSA